MLHWRPLKYNCFVNQQRKLGLICTGASRNKEFRISTMICMKPIYFQLLKFRHNSPHYSCVHITHRNFVRSASLNRRRYVEPKKPDESTIFVPVAVKIPENLERDNIGEELSGKIDKDGVVKLLNLFYKREPIKTLAEENGLDTKLFHQAFLSFRKFCLEAEALPVDLHVIFNDLLHDAGHTDDIFPYFLDHAKQVFPHLSCMEELHHISDIRVPANTYPEARAINRKIIFHAGPTNSGKTYYALERFLSAKTGVYCGPLKLLAVEIFNKANQKGTPCDLVTGEERRIVNADGSQATHVACTVEMTSVSVPYEVAIIDEIQMVRDGHRGWAWTRALLGVAAQEVHVCGEESTISVIQEIVSTLGDEFEVHRYKRLTTLSIEKHALSSLNNVKPGDCIVCFSKNDIFSVSLQLEKKGIECAVIYGGLPPGTKLAQAHKFNDRTDPCKVLVATDAIGMGLNLSIRRVIFNSLMKPVINEKGEKEIDYISTSQALQIGGRAGRYGSDFEEGLVTTFKPQDLPVLKNIMSRDVDLVTQVGLLPTADQLELFSYHLPQATLSNLIDIFVSLSQLDLSRYFMCHIDNFKFLADMIQHISLPMKTRYLFCCAPIDKQQPLVCTMFLKFARQYCRNEAVTFDWLYRNIGWPFSPPKNIVELIHLEASFDVLDLYLWLSYRFIDLFPDGNVVKDMQQELDIVIQQGVINITRLLKASENSKTSAFAKTYEEDDDLLLKNKQLQQGSAKNVKVGGKPNLTESLIAKGLLTKEMLTQLKKELNEEGFSKSERSKQYLSKKKKSK